MACSGCKTILDQLEEDRKVGLEDPQGRIRRSHGDMGMIQQEGMPEIFRAKTHVLFSLLAVMIARPLMILML